jgi:hypothetical protein
MCLPTSCPRTADDAQVWSCTTAGDPGDLLGGSDSLHPMWDDRCRRAAELEGAQSVVRSMSVINTRGFRYSSERCRGMALNVLAYNMKRVMAIAGVGGLLEAMRA